LFAHRISYLPLLLPRLYAFFHDSLIDTSVQLSDGWFSFEDVPLKWHHPIGLLFDLYSGSKEALVAPDSDSPGGSASGNAPEKDILPWKLTLSFSEWPIDSLIKIDPEFAALQDAFQNSVKEAAFVRHNTSRVIMAMGKEDTAQLWESVEKVEVNLFQKTANKLLRPHDRSLLHIPLKLYLPSAGEDDKDGKLVQAGCVHVLQRLVSPTMSNRQPQTLGTALNSLAPAIFPSRRSPLLAYPFLHGAIVPLNVNLAELAEYACYADGFLHIAIAMMR